MKMNYNTHQALQQPQLQKWGLQHFLVLSLDGFRFIVDALCLSVLRLYNMAHRCGYPYAVRLLANLLSPEFK
jgi:hypothetical protein